MRKILSALVGMAGLAAAGYIILLALNEKMLNALVTFTVSGHIPGTDTTLDFTSSLVSGATILAVGLCGAILYRHVNNKDMLSLAGVSNTKESTDDPTEPFDGEDIIMIAAELEQELFRREQSLPVQLQLF